MKNKIKAALLLGLLASGSAYAARMVCDYCNINGETGEMTCYNCRIG